MGNLKVTLAVILFFLKCGYAFNRIHESAYDVESRGSFRSTTTLSIAGIVDSRATHVWHVPLSLAIKVSPKVELGAGLKTVQTSDFDGNLAMDLQPALNIDLARDSMIKVAVALGLAGDQREEMRIKVAYHHGF